MPLLFLPRQQFLFYFCKYNLIIQIKKVLKTKIEELNVKETELKTKENGTDLIDLSNLSDLSDLPD